MYAGVDPVTRRRIFLRETIPPGTNAARLAERARTKFLNQVDEKRNPRTRATVRQAVARWMELEDHASTTRTRHESVIRNHIGPILGDLPLTKLDVDVLVSDDGVYGAAYASGALSRRPMFERFDDDGVVWADGAHERVDTVILATGYLPSLDYLRGMGALDENGLPSHTGGISTTHPGLVYLGLEFKRSFASNTLRGVSADAALVIPPLVAYAAGAANLVAS